MSKVTDTIGKYSDVTLIARGGMGAVYKALHPTLNRPVILKKLTLRGKSTFAERFKREARILMDFRHDDIVTVFDHFKQGTSYFIVMEYVEGMSLEGLIRDYRYLDSVITAYILLHSAKALGYAHLRGVVHRDIKPANILLSRDGAIKLADFGIAASAEEVDSGLTGEGMTLGTPSYMAPEQFENSRNVDAKADIYSLGVMAYEMSTGKRPFPGGFSPELINAKHKGKYPSARQYVPGISRPVMKIIKGAMRSRPKRRYSSVDSLIKHARKVLAPYKPDDVRAYLGALVRGEKNVLPPIPRRRVFKRLMAYAAVVLFISLMVFSAYTATLIQPLVKSDIYGRLRIEVEVPSTMGGYKGIPSEIVLFSDDGNDIPMVSEPLMFKIPFAEEGSNPVFTSLPLYIAGGGYRIKATWGGYVSWSSFVQPGRKEMEESNAGWAHVERVQFPRLESTPVTVTPVVSDAVTGRDISDYTVILVESPNGKMDRLNGSRVLSGKVWKFHIQAAGYSDQLFSLYIRPEETNLVLTVDLLPEPVRVKLINVPDLARIQLNGSSRIMTYRRSEKNSNFSLVPVQMEAPYPGEILLLPGNYRLSVNYKKSEKLIDFNAIAGGTVLLQFELSNDGFNIQNISE